ncbi:MAG: prolipoprotein diacylglyceryl transferase [Ruminococcus sp.]|nr:prolipoprotein diacylglyceryl transferase [Ruminococcus sp.]
MFPSFELFDREIGMYGICVAVGLVLCGFVGTILAKKFGYVFEDFIIVFIAAIVGLFIFAHIVYALTNIPLIILAFKHIGKLWFKNFITLIGQAVGGMVFYGGFIGGYLGIVIYTHFIKTMKREHILDVYAVLIPLFHTFGRIGCFLAGCCYGIESEFGFTVYDNHLNPSINGVNRLPIQLIEAGCNLMIFLIILFLFKKSIMNDRLIYVYMLIYPPIRFVLEFFRGDEIRGIYLGLSTSQWISICLVIFSIIMLIRYHIKQKRSG